MADDAYQKFTSLKMLGDRYLKQHEYKKAAESYEKAMTAWRAPGHPKYEAAADCLRKAMLHIPHTSKVAQDNPEQSEGRLTASIPKKSPPLLWEEGVFRPISVLSRVHTTAVVPTDERKDWLTRFFLNQIEGDVRLKAMMESAGDAPVDLSYEYVPHSGPEFFNICMEKAGVWIESLLQELTTKWFTNFVNEGVFRPPNSSEDEKVMVFTAIFGNERLQVKNQDSAHHETTNQPEDTMWRPKQPQRPNHRQNRETIAPTERKWWQFWK
ncbi:MAG: hypothetical protein ABII09_02840 [Planctomycetota bacterium]